MLTHTTNKSSCFVLLLAGTSLNENWWIMTRVCLFATLLWDRTATLCSKGREFATWYQFWEVELRNVRWERAPNKYGLQGRSKWSSAIIRLTACGLFVWYGNLQVERRVWCLSWHQISWLRPSVVNNIELNSRELVLSLDIKTILFMNS